MRRVDIDDIADSLYGGPPDEFTAARDEAAREAADPAVRKQIKTLRKPTAAAAAVNGIVRSLPADVDSLLDLGAALRATMAGDGSELRHLTEERRGLIAGLTRDVAANVRDDVVATFEAATADPDLGAAVRSGRLVKPLRYAGFGALPDLGDAVATPLATTRPATGTANATATAKVPPTPKAKPAKSAAPPPPPPKPDLTDARERVLELSGVADDAQRLYEQAVQATVDARAALDRAEAARAEAHRAARAAHADAEKARRELGRLERS